MTTQNKFDAIILGAGGAGMMCAAIAGQRGKSVLLLDHAEKPGKKILISGGGRCNFTNSRTTHKNYLSQNIHFAKSALSRYSPQDFIDLVTIHKIDYHEKTLGQLFCDDSAKQIVQMLIDECEKGKVDLRCNEEIKDVTHADSTFTVTTNNKTYHGASLVIATGGPSIPKMGATGFAYELARKFGLKIIEPKPALVPFTLGQNEALFKSLSGVSTEIIARHEKTEFKEAGLFTHKGLSGPAILQISSYWKHGDPIWIDFIPQDNNNWLIEAKKQNPKRNMRKILSSKLPERLAGALCDHMRARVNVDSDMGNLPDKLLNSANEKLKDWKFNPNGTEGFAKAEVTIGGISTAELSSKTMEAKKVPGLFCIGEAVDVTGWLGGYNFQWAWASGFVAGEVL